MDSTSEPDDDELSLIGLRERPRTLHYLQWVPPNDFREDALPLLDLLSSLQVTHVLLLPPAGSSSDGSFIATLGVPGAVESDSISYQVVAAAERASVCREEHSTLQASSELGAQVQGGLDNAAYAANNTPATHLGQQRKDRAGREAATWKHNISFHRLVVLVGPDLDDKLPRELTSAAAWRSKAEAVASLGCADGASALDGGFMETAEVLAMVLSIYLSQKDHIMQPEELKQHLCSNPALLYHASTKLLQSVFPCSQEALQLYWVSASAYFVTACKVRNCV